MRRLKKSSHPTTSPSTCTWTSTEIQRTLRKRCSRNGWSKFRHSRTTWQKKRSKGANGFIRIFSSKTTARICLLGSITRRSEKIKDWGNTRLSMKIELNDAIRYDLLERCGSRIRCCLLDKMYQKGIGCSQQRDKIILRSMHTILWHIWIYRRCAGVCDLTAAYDK